MVDISHLLAPKSDQLDAVDLLGGPQTFTIDSVSVDRSEQPMSIRLREFPRVWRPGLSMRRVMAAVWGGESDAWVGQRVTLFCEPRVKFGGEEVGGTRISHLTGITETKRIPLIISKGKTAVYVVKPLVEQAPAPAAPPAEPMTAETRDRFFTLFDEVHPTPKTSRQQAQLDYIGQALGYGVPAPSLSVVTEAQLQAVVAALEAEAAQGVAAQLPVEEPS